MLFLHEKLTVKLLCVSLHTNTTAVQSMNISRNTNFRVQRLILEIRPSLSLRRIPLRGDSALYRRHLARINCSTCWSTWSADGLASTAMQGGPLILR